MSRVRTALLVGLTSVVLATAGCSGDDGTTERPRPSTSPPASAAATSPSTAAAPPEPTSTVAPATGRLIKGSLVSLYAPAEFPGPFTRSQYGGIMAGDTGYSLTLQDDETTSIYEDVDSLAKLSQETSLYEKPLERQPDTTIAGLPAYHLAGPDATFDNVAEEWGLRTEGHTVQITLGTPTDLPQAERDALAASILASVTIGG